MKTGREETASQDFPLDVLWCFIDQHQHPSRGIMITVPEAERLSEAFRAASSPLWVWQELVPPTALLLRASWMFLCSDGRWGRRWGEGYSPLNLVLSDVGDFLCTKGQRGCTRGFVKREGEREVWAFGVFSPASCAMDSFPPSPFIDLNLYQQHQRGAEIPYVNSMGPCLPKMSQFHRFPAPCPSSHALSIAGTAQTKLVLAE